MVGSSSRAVITMIGTCEAARIIEISASPSTSGRPRSSSTTCGWSAEHLLEAGHAGAARGHGVPALGEPPAYGAADRLVVLDDQDAGHARTVRRPRAARAARRAGWDDAVMSSRRTVALGVAAWLVVVTAGAGLVWAVISRAGEGVAGSAQPGVGASPAAAAPADPTGTGRPSTPATQDPDRAGRQTWSDTPGYVTALCEGARDQRQRPRPTRAGGSRSTTTRSATGRGGVRVRSTSAARMRVDRGLLRRRDPAFEVDDRTKG